MAMNFDKIAKQAIPIFKKVGADAVDMIQSATPYIKVGVEKATPYVKKGIDTIKQVDWKQVGPAVAISSLVVKLKKDKDIADINEQHEDTMQKVKVVVADLHEQYVKDQVEIQDLKQTAVTLDEEEL